MNLGKQLFLFVCLFLVSCGGSTFSDGEDYGNLLDSEAGLILTEEEHVGGWGRADCTTCHNLENIHLVNRTGIPIDVDAIREETLEEGVSSCPDCHGLNGLEEEDFEGETDF